MIRSVHALAGGVLLVLALVPAPVAAFELSLPSGARQLADRNSPFDTYALPIGPFAQGRVPTRVFEGQIERQSWKIDKAAPTTLQLLDPLRAQLIEAGFDIVYQCEDTVCGGFDFRFLTETIPAPDMHVDIRDFRFLAGVREETDAISLVVSRSRLAGYVQVIRAVQGDLDPLLVVPATEAGRDVILPTETGIAASLLGDGHVVLRDLRFDTGADTLGAGDYPSLRDLAGLMIDRPGLRIALVGHTDSVGDLEANISLSRRRAESVRERMIDEFGIAPERVLAEGMGFLAPVSSNLTIDGREQNRRVEAILLSDDG